MLHLGLLLAPLLGDDQDRHPAREMYAYRIDGPVRIDGSLDEAVWQRPGVTGFIQRDPIEGATPSHKTEVIVAYDDDALYVAARLYDAAPDSITRRLARRDDSATADKFTVEIDPWLDHRTGFFFVVNAAGAIRDGTLFNDDNDDDSWDGIWESSARINGKGWIVELRIPFSQLRFPDRPVHIWGINFAREIERHNEQDMYVMIPKTAGGRVSWFAHLHGIEGIRRPRYLELLPFSSGKVAYSHPETGDPFNDGSLGSGQLGLDMKLGLTSSLTLDATINPDFGQVEVDPAVVNLSDFETFFPEKRPFFIEGRDIFRFGRGGTNNNWNFNYGDPTHFYSRRIGRRPQVEPAAAYDYQSTPLGTTILGAAKISGKLTPEWSLGVMSAVTAREYTQVDLAGTSSREEVEPLTSYNVVRALREFGDGRHGLGVITSFMARDLRTPNLVASLSRSAYDAGLDGWVTLDSDRTYVISGWLATSQIAGSEPVMQRISAASPHYLQRPDVDHLGFDSSATRLAGVAGRLYLNKQKGDVIFNSGLAAVSPGYDVNDFGFQWNADQINWHIALGHQNYDPGKFLRSYFITVATFRNWDWGSHRYGAGYFLFTNVELLNYWSLNLNGGAFPATLSKDMTRGGVMAVSPASRFVEGGLSTDRRKTLSISLGMSYGRATRVFRSLRSSVTWKPGPSVELSLEPRLVYDVTEANWVDVRKDPTATVTAGSRYLFAETVQNSFSLDTRLNWTLSPTISLQFFAQPLIFAIDYFDYKELAAPSEFLFNIFGENGGSTIVRDDAEATYTIDPDGPGPAESFVIDDRDFNFKSLRANLIFRWEYRPGSVFYFAWNHNRSAADLFGDFHISRDLGALGAIPGDNTLLIKFTYWLAP